MAYQANRSPVVISQPQKQTRILNILICGCSFLLPVCILDWKLKYVVLPFLTSYRIYASPDYSNHTLASACTCAKFLQHGPAKESPGIITIIQLALAWTCERISWNYNSHAGMQLTSAWICKSIALTIDNNIV
jgi:hypothetical protein